LNGGDGVHVELDWIPGGVVDLTGIIYMMRGKGQVGGKRKP
jgi:hypothetical protein